jgi:Kef-type K+ transport system membrane component KefB
VTNHEVGAVALALLLLLLGANLFGLAAARLRQPKVVGEILAGIVLGPTLLGHLAPGTWSTIFGDGVGDAPAMVLGFMYHFGLFMLMFVSGFSVRHVLGPENRAPTAWILGLGTPLPFLLALAITPWLPIDDLTGQVGSSAAVILILATAAVVTSIPVITKIFHDLGILETRFASLMLGVAVFQDILLWGVLAVATAIATATVVAADGSLGGSLLTHLSVNALYVVAALLVVPRLLRRLSRARWNVLPQQTPVAWVMSVLFAYVAVAALVDVTLVFAAFLAGFGVVGGFRGTERERFRPALDSVEQVAVGVFIPVYFAIVGYRLDLRESLDIGMLLGFLLGSSLLTFGGIGLASRLAGFRRLDLVNLAITCNARGGPGIVLASVAFDAGIINAPFFTTLVVTAVLTSQACGAWLEHVMRRGAPLLSGVDLERRGLERRADRAPARGGEPPPVAAVAPEADPV